MYIFKHSGTSFLEFVMAITILFYVKTDSLWSCSTEPTDLSDYVSQANHVGPTTAQLMDTKEQSGSFPRVAMLQFQAQNENKSH